MGSISIASLENWGAIPFLLLSYAAFFGCGVESGDGLESLEPPFLSLSCLPRQLGGGVPRVPAPEPSALHRLRAPPEKPGDSLLSDEKPGLRERKLAALRNSPWLSQEAGPTSPRQRSSCAGQTAARAAVPCVRVTAPCLPRLCAQRPEGQHPPLPGLRQEVEERPLCCPPPLQAEGPSGGPS